MLDSLLHPFHIIDPVKLTYGSHVSHTITPILAEKMVSIFLCTLDDSNFSSLSFPGTHQPSGVCIKYRVSQFELQSKDYTHSSLETHKPNYRLQMETEYDYLFKIVLIGDAGVGKTSIVRRYTDGIFTSAGIPTIGVDFCIKTLQIGSSAVKVGINWSGDNF